MLAAIAESGTVTHAAGRIGITQSALTHRIREAERRLGLPLFTRTGRRLIMTPAGERLHAVAMRVIDDLSRAEDEVRVLSGHARQVVRLGQGTYSRFHYLPDFLKFLAEAAPDLEVDLIAQATHYPLTTLQEGIVDVALVYGAKPSASAFQSFHLARDPLVAIMAPDHPLAAKPYIVAEDLREERYITYSLTPEPGFEWESFMRPANVIPRRVSRVQLPEAIIDLVRAGFGVSILSSWAVEPEVNNGTLAARPVTRDGLMLDWWAVVREGDGAASAAMRLVEAMLVWGRRDEGGLATLGFKPGQTEPEQSISFGKDRAN